MNVILQHKLIAALVLIAVIAVAWYELSASPAAPSSLLSTSAAGGADQQLVSTLLTLRAVTLSGAIFNDQSFKTLQDFTTQIQPEPVGRTDPFAPLPGAAVGPQATSTPAAQNQKLFAPKK